MDHHTQVPEFHIWERTKNWIFDRTVAIYFRKPGGNAVQWGSGVLLQMGGAAFVVSASHVMEIAHEGAEILLGSMCVGTRGLVSLGESRIVRTNDREKLDVAFVRLPDSAIEALAPLKRFVQLSELDLVRAMPQGRYYIAGYPIQLTQTDHSTKTITVGTYAYGTHLVDSDHSHRGISIALAHGKDSIIRTGDGEQARAPHLRGVSGCGIWRLWPSEDFEHLADWDESWIRLVGLEHRTVGEVIVGTLACHVLEMLVRTEPVELTLSNKGMSLRFP